MARALWRWSQENAPRQGRASAFGPAFRRLLAMAQKALFLAHETQRGSPPQNRKKPTPPLWSPAKVAAIAQGSSRRVPRGVQVRESLALAASSAWREKAAAAGPETLSAWFVAALNASEPKIKLALEISRHPDFDWHRSVGAKKTGAAWARRLANGALAGSTAISAAQALLSFLGSRERGSPAHPWALWQKPGDASRNIESLETLARVASARAEQWALQSAMANAPRCDSRSADSAAAPKKGAAAKPRRI